MNLAEARAQALEKRLNELETRLTKLETLYALDTERRLPPHQSSLNPETPTPMGPRRE